MRNLLRLVLDTNVILSGLLYGGLPSRVIRLGRSRRIQVFTSLFILDELSQILSRGKFQQRIRESGLSIPELVAAFANAATVVTPQPVPRTAPDPDDDVILATAIAARADFLVTGDKPLLSLGTHAGFEILTVNAFLGKLAL